MKRPTAVQRYIAQNILSRWGQAVTRLAEAGLVPEMPDSESEVHEWWLVSPAAARGLRAAGQPVLQFCELYMWGRTQGGGRVEDDRDLAAAARSAEPQSPSGR